MDEARLVHALGDIGVQAAYLFGSRAAGTATGDSDADVALLAGRSIGLLEEQRIAATLGAAAGVPVDVGVLDRASLELRGRVVQEGRLLYSSDEATRVRFEVRTRSEFFDFAPKLLPRNGAKVWTTSMGSPGPSPGC